ncbi:hypothetical protein F5Y17DRAFT_8323 [Xylariaceae sp. FL0594]|nr:hypothetical protein F5Y17DRAFT_8323 [Xylariaceae sp. FL0594]
MPFLPKYSKLSESDSDVDFTEHLIPSVTASKRSRRRTVFLWSALLIASNLLTWFISTRYGRGIESSGDKSRTLFAGLEWDQPMTLHSENPYNQRDEKLRDAAWDAINIDDGMVALPHTYAKEKGLPESQPFPWDRSKGIYLLNGHHSLHCAKAIYISLSEFKNGRPQSRKWGHVLHCVDHLRKEAICHADDTPRFSTSSDIPVTGLDQVRQCRSWDRLEAWARQHTACYRYINATKPLSEFPQIERFVWCPEGSPYVKEVEKVFGHIEWDEHGFTISEPVKPE